MALVKSSKEVRRRERGTSRTTDVSVPRYGRERVARTDIGLELLSAVAIHGVRYTHDEIAWWCGCTGGAIWLIEQKALRKLRNRLLFIKDPRLREMVDGLFDASEYAKRKKEAV